MLYLSTVAIRALLHPCHVKDAKYQANLEGYDGDFRLETFGEEGYGVGFLGINNNILNIVDRVGICFDFGFSGKMGTGCK